jgi:SAM-dependent methyltransferase
LILKASLGPGRSLLDVGCGQGFFSSLFAEFGLKTVGVDHSVEEINSAKTNYGFSEARFEVGDALYLGCEGANDCVFARGLSLCNKKNFESAWDITNVLLSYLKPSGLMISEYYTKLSPNKKSQSWIYHSLADAQKHVSSYPGARVYFSIRIDTFLFGKLALSILFTRLSAFISQITGIGGELVAFVPRDSLALAESSSRVNPRQRGCGPADGDEPGMYRC